MFSILLFTKDVLMRRRKWLSRYSSTALIYVCQMPQIKVLGANIMVYVKSRAIYLYLCTCKLYNFINCNYSVGNNMGVIKIM